MASHDRGYPKFHVPQGWRKGAPLSVLGTGPRYALCQQWDPKAPLKEVGLNDIWAVEFPDLGALTDWWYWWTGGRSKVFLDRVEVKPSPAVRDIVLWLE